MYSIAGTVFARMYAFKVRAYTCSLKAKTGHFSYLGALGFLYVPVTKEASYIYFEHKNKYVICMHENIQIDRL
jgi:hypothetical protein